MPDQTTFDEETSCELQHVQTSPGLVVIFTAGRPACTPLRPTGGQILLGREANAGVAVIADARISRQHVRITFEDDGVRVTDLKSRNGTFVDGVQVQDRYFQQLPRALRVGHTLLAFVPNLAPFVAGRVEVCYDIVIGPALRQCHEQIARFASDGESMLVSGPSGAGKELAARAFHRATERSGPFIAVNCATIPGGLAERLLFGTRRGAYSGAVADADGYVQAAQGGTLFLDEIGDIEASVQPKLLRLLESREVLELGASRPRKVDVRVCAATLKDLRAEVQGGRFREDLYYRIGQPVIALPPLSARLDELPWHVQSELRRADKPMTASAAFLEACALRAWPGNVRELLLEVRQAMRSALDSDHDTLEPRDLSPCAGQPSSISTTQRSERTLTREAIEAALRLERGNVSGTARRLGIHRTQLRRWIARSGLDTGTFAVLDDKEHPSGIIARSASPRAREEC